MTDDEMNRKMEFIVEQQARFEVGIQQLKERQDRFQLHLEAVEARQDRFDERLDKLSAKTELALEAWTKTAEVVESLATSLAESQRRTDRRLDRLARLIYAHVREGHPPGAPGA